MRALVEQASGYEVVLVASNKPDAAGLEWARVAGHRDLGAGQQGISRRSLNDRLGTALDQHAVGTIALAGFMRILSPAFVERWSGRIVNIHPSLLPKYRGLDTHRRAIDAGRSHGRLLGPRRHRRPRRRRSARAKPKCRSCPETRPASLEQRVLAAEHALYPRILSEFVKR